MFSQATGILTVDITDHLPIFCLVRTQPTRNNSNKKYFRDYSKFNKDLYLDDIKLIDWHEILNPEKNLNEKVQEAINTLNKIVDKHAPIKLASQSKHRQLNKPWLTKGILKSVKREQKMYLLSRCLQKQGVHMARIDFTRGFHFQGGDTPSFGVREGCCAESSPLF